MPVSPLIEESNVFSFSILSAGTEIPSAYEIMSMNISIGIGKLSSAEITVRDGSSASQTFEVTDSDTFKPGTEIEIKLGYQSKNDTIFKGIVTKESISVSEGSSSSLKISCKDKAEVLTKNKEKATYLKKKDSEIIQAIIENASGLSAEVTATTLVNEEIVKPNISDWDFINMLAEKNGMIVTTDAGKVTVAAPNVSATPELQIQFGYDMIEFDSEINAVEQYSSVECSAFDPATQKMISATAKDPTLNKEGDITGSTLSSVLSANPLKLTKSAPLPQDELQAWADSILLRLRLSQFTGTVSFHGSPKAKVNTLIKLIGLSERFNGDSYISGVTHSISGGGWTTTAEIGMSPESFAEKNELLNPGSEGVSPPVHGLQTGIVKKINEDPNNEFRVQVQMPILGENSDPIWARLSTFYAGNTFGAFFMPEIDDEVILGFMDDNPSYPIILGSVFSSKIPAPLTPDDKNSIKTLITQSKLQLKFDEENKILSIITPGGNTIVLSDKDKGITLTDQNSNVIQMNDKGITLNSQSNISIKAAQDIKIEGVNISLSGSQSIKEEGGQITVSGNQSVKIDGTAECAISSNGQMSVKGTTVMIN